ncbi:MAG: hydroxymethylglutaryl-CoA lyase, partial [Pacificibacter sp.]
VARVAKALIDLGCYEISLGDTIGKGTPETVNKMLDAVLDVVPAERLAGHFHETSGRAIENIAASLSRGVRVFDSSVGGLGGCPYAPGASGNVATEAVVAFLHGQGIETGIDVDKLAEVGRFAKTLRTD